MSVVLIERSKDDSDKKVVKAIKGKGRGKKRRETIFICVMCDGYIITLMSVMEDLGYPKVLVDIIGACLYEKSYRYLTKVPVVLGHQTRRRYHNLCSKCSYQTSVTTNRANVSLVSCPVKDCPGKWKVLLKHLVLPVAGHVL